MRVERFNLSSWLPIEWASCICLQGWKLEDSASEAYLITLLQGLFLNYSPNLLKSFSNPFCWKHRPKFCSVFQTGTSWSVLVVG